MSPAEAFCEKGELLALLARGSCSSSIHRSGLCKCRSFLLGEIYYSTMDRKANASVYTGPLTVAGAASAVSSIAGAVGVVAAAGAVGAVVPVASVVPLVAHGMAPYVTQAQGIARCWLCESCFISLRASPGAAHHTASSHLTRSQESKLVWLRSSQHAVKIVHSSASPAIGAICPGIMAPSLAMPVFSNCFKLKRGSVGADSCSLSSEPKQPGIAI